ncbi:MAG: N-acetylmuramic acid 6-phosphate etherase [Terriglobales bacterium]
MRNRAKAKSHLSDLATEQSNPASADFDRKSSLQIARIMNSEDSKVAAAVRRSLPQIANAIDWIAQSLGKGGRLIYVGTGTSGRIAALDAAECPPTFNTDPKTVQFVIAGGLRALGSAVESNEDSAALGEREIAKKNPGRNDIVVGVAASGRTPFTIGAVRYARRKGAKTIAVVCNRHSLLERAAHIAIVVETGPEVISGSTRMKAGTAQKMVLNMLTTGALTRIGYVYGNLMVHVGPKNHKLATRAVTILERAAGISQERAKKILKASHGSLPAALVSVQAGVGAREAENALRLSRGNVRQAISQARLQSHK